MLIIVGALGMVTKKPNKKQRTENRRNNQGLFYNNSGGFIIASVIMTPIKTLVTCLNYIIISTNSLKMKLTITTRQVAQFNALI